MSDNASDHYSVLGVEPTASQIEIKRAYRRLVFLYHPDRNPDDEDAVDNFKRILKAYEVLSDNDKRTQYDEATQSVFKDRPPRSDIPGTASSAAAAEPKWCLRRTARPCPFVAHCN